MSTDLTTAPVATSAVASFNPSVVGSSRTTMVASTMDDRLEFFKAVSDAKSAEDLKDKEFKLLNFIQTVVEFPNEVSGELESTVQNIILTDLGTYQIFSSTVARDLDRMVTVLGEPSGFPASWRFVLRHVKSANSNLNKYYTIKAA